MVQAETLGEPRGVVLQLGSQSEQALARMCEDLGMQMDVLPGDTPAQDLVTYDLVVPSGGASSVYDEDSPQLDPAIFDKDFEPLVVGICLGSQKMVHHGGGRVIPADEAGHGTYGSLGVEVVDDRKEGGFNKIQSGEFVHSNGDHYTEETLPEGSVVLAKTGEHVAAFLDTVTGNVGIQFHPELSGPLGYGIIRNILLSHGIELNPQPKDLFQHMVAEINEGHQGDDVVIGFSGGIDSNVVAEAAIASDIPPEKLHIVMFDFGVNRTEEGIAESETSLARFHDRTGIMPDLIALDVQQVLHSPITLVDADGKPDGEYILSEVIDSELKRRVFSQWYANAFTDYFAQKGLDLDHTKLVQGTLYPDVIESLGSGKVKTHHNQSPPLQYLKKNGRTIDPAQRYFKNDMRHIGESRGFDEIDWRRQPFPGPGLVPRIICSDGTPILPENHTAIWEQAKELVGDEFGVALGGFRTVGQKGDRRSYAWPILLTGEPDWERMNQLMVDLGNAFPAQVNRVYYVTGDRVDGIATSANMTPTYINEESLNQLRPIDDFATGLLRVTGALAVTDQVPIGLLPTALHVAPGERTAFLRPFRTPKTNSFLNGEAVRPDKEPSVAAWYRQVVAFALQQPGIARVAYDLTHKPYGSTEAE